MHLDFATTGSGNFLLAIMEKPGYTALLLGEMIHAVQFVPVEVTVQPTVRCYTESPQRNNETKWNLPAQQLFQLAIDWNDAAFSNHLNDLSYQA